MHSPGQRVHYRGFLIEYCPDSNTAHAFGLPWHYTHKSCGVDAPDHWCGPAKDLFQALSMVDFFLDRDLMAALAR